MTPAHLPDSMWLKETMFMLVDWLKFMVRICSEGRVFDEMDLDLFPGESVVLLGRGVLANQQLPEVMGELDMPAAGTLDLRTRPLRKRRSSGLICYRRDIDAPLFSFII